MDGLCFSPLLLLKVFVLLMIHLVADGHLLHILLLQSTQRWTTSSLDGGAEI